MLALPFMPDVTTPVALTLAIAAFEVAKVTPLVSTSIGSIREVAAHRERLSLAGANERHRAWADADRGQRADPERVPDAETGPRISLSDVLSAAGRVRLATLIVGPTASVTAGLPGLSGKVTFATLMVGPSTSRSCVHHRRDS